MQKSISDFINENYREYSKYVTYSRAIPSLVDGMKPVNRKAFYILKKKRDLVKVMSVSGAMIADANYHHGDASSSTAISMMAQNFPGSNNIPIFLKKGSFGTQFINQPSAPRYIYVKANPFFDKVYKDYEICPPSDDLDDPEPKFYLPMIPTVLLNGIKGIAVGFATEIQPYNIDDIIENVLLAMGGRSLRKMKPYFGKYAGEIKLDEEDRWVQYGKYEIVNTTTIKITEVPTSFDREKYLTHLAKLQENGHINSYRDSTKENWNLLIKLPRKSKIFRDPIKYLRLYQVLSENITVLDHKGRIKIFECPEDVVKWFVQFRTNVCSMRRKYMMNKLQKEISMNRGKIKFIEHMSVLDLRKKTKREIFELMLKEGFKPDQLKIYMQLEAYRLSKTEIDKAFAQISKLKDELEWYRQITPEKLYRLDLRDLKKSVRRLK